jgi:hypothetical protein
MNVSVCADCGAPLVDALPEDIDGKEPIVIASAATANEAQIIVATLQSQGIPAYTAPPGAYLPQHGNPVASVSPEFLVWVPADAEADARAVLEAAPVSEAELFDAEQATDPEPDVDEEIEPGS